MQFLGSPCRAQAHTTCPAVSLLIDFQSLSVSHRHQACEGLTNKACPREEVHSAQVCRLIVVHHRWLVSVASLQQRPADQQATNSLAGLNKSSGPHMDTGCFHKELQCGLAIPLGSSLSSLWVMHVTHSMVSRQQSQLSYIGHRISSQGTAAALLFPKGSSLSSSQHDCPKTP